MTRRDVAGTTRHAPPDAENPQRGFRCSRAWALAGRTIKRLGVRFKKTGHASEHARADVRRARTAWRAAAPTLDPARRVFLDESGVRTDLIRRAGRGLSGARVPDHTPDGRWHTTTFLGALRVTGLTAPAVFDGPIAGASFLAYIEQVLMPTLAPGDIVIMDNL